MTAQGLSFDIESQGDIPLKLAMTIEPGELVVLLGPSGSGKSTLLRCLAGLYTPIKGQIYCNHECWFDSEKDHYLKPEKRSLGMVYQSYALFPHLSALQNVMLPLIRHPKEIAKSTATQWLAKVNLAGLENRKPHELSGGQKQRVALARALAGNPKLLLLDEPFSAVDQMTRIKLRRELAKLRTQINTPIVLVTHDLDEAVQLADRICVLHHGQMLQIDSPENLLSQPQSKTVARLLGFNLHRD